MPSSKIPSTQWFFLQVPCEPHRHGNFQHASPAQLNTVHDVDECVRSPEEANVPAGCCSGCCRSVGQPHQPSGQRPSREQNAAACHRWQLLRDLRSPSHSLPARGEIKIPCSALLLQPALPGRRRRSTACLPASVLSLLEWTSARVQSVPL